MESNCTQTCQNTAGSYQCDCHFGYDLDVDGFTCNGEQLIFIPVDVLVWN